MEVEGEGPGRADKKRAHIFWGWHRFLVETDENSATKTFREDSKPAVVREK